MRVHRLGTCVGIAIMGLGLSVGTAHAADTTACPEYSHCTGAVQGEELALTPDVAPAAVAATEAPATAPQGQLPLTGGDVAELVLIGGAALGLGTLMVRRTRTRTTS
jgi:LPXTG-motif cell wall-anchored protein